MAGRVILDLVGNQSTCADVLIQNSKGSLTADLRNASLTKAAACFFLCGTDVTTTCCACGIDASNTKCVPACQGSDPS